MIYYNSAFEYPTIKQNMSLFVLIFLYGVEHVYVTVQEMYLFLYRHTKLRQENTIAFVNPLAY
jgi:hypothetical protein